MIGLVDYGCGNIKSVGNALSRLGQTWQLVSTEAQVMASDRLILPGVGAFGEAMALLERSGLKEALDETVLIEKTPVLGICLGMQLMCNFSEEGGHVRGLGWIDADVTRIPSSPEIKVPHMGWNELDFRSDHELVDSIPMKSDVYFVHSYAVSCKRSEDVVCTTSHGVEFVSAFSHQNVWGVQFHPEKSQNIGLKILGNFVGNQHVKETSDRSDHSAGWSGRTKRTVSAY